MADELDFAAAFEQLSNTPEMQVLEERIAEQHPSTHVWAKRDDITVRLQGERGYIVFAVPVASLQSMVAAWVHIQDHGCPPSAEFLNQTMRAMLSAVYDTLKKDGRLPPPEDVGMDHG